jgi:hypothetical protein
MSDSLAWRDVILLEAALSAEACRVVEVAL